MSPAALAVATEALPAYAHRFSPRKFTPPQLFAGLVLTTFLVPVRRITSLAE